MSDKLTDIQLMWLRGLASNDCWTPMSASELGNPEVSELQSRELVKIRTTTFCGREWIILPAGRLTVASVVLRDALASSQRDEP